MLNLSRYPNQSITIGDDIVVKVYRIEGKKVQLSVTAPRDVRVMRIELLEAETEE